MSLSRSKKEQLKVRAAYMYYKKKMKLSDIADELAVSRVTLNRLLDDALNEGIVRIDIVDPSNTAQIIELEDTVRQRFDLREVHIVDTPEDESLISGAIAEAAADYLDARIESGMKISLSWGRTLALTVNAMDGNPLVNDIEVFTLLGARGMSNIAMQPSTIAYNLLLKYNGTGHIMNAPFMCSSERAKDIILADRSITDVLENSRDSDLTLVGLGPSPGYKTSSQNQRYDDATIEELNKYKISGDICSNFYDVYGQLISAPITRRFINVPLSDIKNHKCKIALAGGLHKTASILGAMNGHFIDILFTDRNTILNVLQLADGLGI